MSPRTQLQAIVLGCVLALLAATQALTHWAGRAHHADLEAQRDAYLLHSLRTAAENYLAIGLDLDQMDALQGLIERERAGFSQVLAIDVFAANGTLLYSTDPNSRGGTAPERWRQGLAQNGPWRIDSASQRQMGLRFDNDLGQAAGGIVLTLSTAPQPLTLAQWKARGLQTLQVAALVGVACLAAWAGVALGLRRLLRPYERVARILQGQPAATQEPASALEQSARQTHTAWAAAQARAQAGLRQLQELDDAD